ncbi:hypothetical protein F5144DRAFT_42227 [Chaetomium tenue]|uniref:Uncharacterized protein n=1 Tax=Chaetomium tenue TaxID=1854479 RepID=A0ACB7PNK0_9PEZI|nr:hypothetical protein F5144DRAFT_42227 [Chaetomium globosum]
MLLFLPFVKTRRDLDLSIRDAEGEGAGGRIKSIGKDERGFEELSAILFSLGKPGRRKAGVWALTSPVGRMTSFPIGTARRLMESATTPRQATVMLFPALQPIQPSRRDRDSCRVVWRTGMGLADCCRWRQLVHGREQIPRCFNVSWGQQTLGGKFAMRGVRVPALPHFAGRKQYQRCPWFVRHAEKSRPHGLVLAHANVVWGTNAANQSLGNQFKGTLRIEAPLGLWVRGRWDTQGVPGRSVAGARLARSLANLL